MTNRSAGADYQALAAEFRVGDRVIPYGASRDLAGRVVAVWPGIGMVDVEFPQGAKRYGVEELQRLNHEGEPNPPHDGYVPGGAGTVSVPGGPVAQAQVQHKPSPVSVDRVAHAFVKQALYWAAADRRYKATAEELESGHYNCPKCKKAALKRAIYRRMKGKSERLYGCPSCLFLIERDSILGDKA